MRAVVRTGLHTNLGSAELDLNFTTWITLAEIYFSLTENHSTSSITHKGNDESDQHEKGNHAQAEEGRAVATPRS